MPKTSETTKCMFSNSFNCRWKWGYGSFKMCSCLLIVYFFKKVIRHAYIILSMCNAGCVQYNTEFVIWIKYGVLCFQLTWTTWLALQRCFLRYWQLSVGGIGGRGETLHVAWLPKPCPEAPPSSAWHISKWIAEGYNFCEIKAGFKRSCLWNGF